ncbi:MAG TPA: hypothetical protein VM240_08850 [Verrucomicrobiae bacterium]|nr:hypothetical protein [Verrucomicrobiae bacterium]
MSNLQTLLPSLAAPHSLQAHDLCNCLYLVTSFAELLRDGAAGAVSDPQKELLAHVIDSARRAQALVDRVLRPGTLS